MSATWAFLLGYTLVAVAFLLWCLAVVSGTVRTFGGLGNALAWPVLRNQPLKEGEKRPKPAELVATVVAIDGIIAVLAGVLYLVPIFAQMLGVVQSVDALFAKNMVYLFGHTFVNLNIYLAVALVYATLPVYTGRELKLSKPVALAFNLVIPLVLLPYFHHLYQDFAQPMPLHVAGQFGSYAVGVPAVLVTIVGSLGLLYGSRVRWSAPVIFILAGLWGWTVGGFAAVIDSTIAINNVMHNTLWVPAHFHSYYLFGAAGFTWAYLFQVLGDAAGWATTTWARRLSLAVRRWRWWVCLSLLPLRAPKCAEAVCCSYPGVARFGPSRCSFRHPIECRFSRATRLCTAKSAGRLANSPRRGASGRRLAVFGRAFCSNQEQGVRFLHRSTDRT